MPSGKPELDIDIKFKERFFIENALVSIYHLREYAVAAVVIEGKKKQKPTSPESA